MHELLSKLPEEALVLDLGCAAGSFDSNSIPFAVVRVDLEPGSPDTGNFVQADAAKLPFIAKAFDVIISNHSLEHFDSVADALTEMGRVLKSDGALYIAVPDATTISDRLYRWVGRGGGHVNQFTSAKELALMIERATGLSHVATRTLCTSFSFFNRHNCRTRMPRKLLVLGAGTQVSLFLWTYFLRLLDRFLATRTSVYGWALYFGKIDALIDSQTGTNVCIRCGSGHYSAWLHHTRVVRRFLFVSTYRCPNCGNMNLLTEDEHYGHLNLKSK